MHAHQTAPRTVPPVDGARSALAVCVEACHDAAQSCAATIDARLEDERPGGATFLRAARECMDVCVAAEAVAARRLNDDPTVLRLLLQACVAAGDRFAALCAAQGDAHHDFRLGALSARRCVRACDAALARLPEAMAA
jgi:hypothetical protein